MRGCPLPAASCPGEFNVYQFRPFRNTDPPHLAEIWRSQPPQRGILQPVSAPLLEHAVFSKMHFDRRGLIVATLNDKPVGFVHAGFGPNESGAAIDTSLGTTYLLMLRAGHEDDALADGLLGSSEAYLRGQGATVIYAGGIKPLNSFYLGLYGGSEIPGVLKSNTVLCAACERAGYHQAAEVSILQCDLVRYRPAVSRKVRQLRRAASINETLDPTADNWWEACVWGSQLRDHFQLVDKPSQKVVASTSFWDVQPLSASWGVCTAGLCDLYVDPDWRRKGCATYLLGEAFRLLRRRGVGTVEAQTMSTNEAAIAFYEQLGFIKVDHGLVFRKDATLNNGVARTDELEASRV
jgi:ribosomal protein S18 acetylase RimI-like enzyme